VKNGGRIVTNDHITTMASLIFTVCWWWGFLELEMDSRERRGVVAGMSLCMQR
jgi:hypothetical protein